MAKAKTDRTPSVLGFAIMQLLTRSKESGYDLKKRFHSSIGHGWHAYDTQIYRELRSMEANGLIKGQVAKGLGGPQRRIYSVTDDGLEMLVEWLNSPVELNKTKDEFALRVWTADLFPGDTFSTYLKNAIAETRRALDAARAARQVLVEEYGDLRDAPPATFGRLLAIDLSISKSEARIAWAEQALDAVRRRNRRRAAKKS